MTWTFSDDLDTYLGVAGELVAARPVENTLLLTVASTLRRRGAQAYGEAAPLFGWWRGADDVVEGAVVWTPPHPLMVSPVPADAVAPLARACEKHGVPMVNADPDTAGLLAAEWPAHRILMRQRLYRLGELIPPSPAPPGRARQAAVADRTLLLDWYRAFGRDTGVQTAGAEAAVDDRLSYGGLMLWVHDGVPVSMAGMSRPAEGTVRMAPVYSPPEHRGHGYGGAVTAAMSEAALVAGAPDVLLFTDLANPTSNGIYRRIGYRPVTDRTVICAP
ncbi:GNAT family N-acetyltransferase [Streptomyces sp. NPDC021093]|uniref:GNAT family N-acetyltransferase n=1 Tax=Streptomyces sp. NPDC021093 TaxID=3365112 RepID=UPI00378D71C5